MAIARASTRTSSTSAATRSRKITINRPEVRNAFRPPTLAELRDAFTRARDDTGVAAIIFTGAGDEAFCSGGDQRIRGDDGYIGDDEVAQQGVGRLDVGDLHVQIRRLPKPVVAMVAGYAVGGGHILHLVCDLTIAADNAVFGQTGPRVGQLRRRLRRLACSPATSASRRRRRSGSCPGSTTRTRRSRWGSSTPSCRSATSSARPSPGAARWPPSPPSPCDCSSRASTPTEDGLAGIQQLSHDATLLFYMTEEGQEGRNAYQQGRSPDFSKYPKRP